MNDLDARIQDHLLKAGIDGMDDEVLSTELSDDDEGADAVDAAVARRAANALVRHRREARGGVRAGAGEYAGGGVIGVADTAFPGGFTWRRAWLVWRIFWLGVRAGAAERREHPLRLAPRALLRFVRLMRMWRSGLTLERAIAIEQAR